MTALSAGDAAAVIKHVEWLRAIKRSPNTISDRVYLLARLNRWLANQSPPKTLGTATEEDLARWQVSISRLSANTVATYVAHACGYFRWLAAHHHAEIDVSVLLQQPNVPAGLPRPIADDDLADILRITSGQLRIAFLLIAFCGLRVGELSRLDRQDIRDRTKPPVVIVQGKGGKVRIVRMPGDLGSELRACGMPVRGNVILAPSGNAYSPNRLSQVINGFLHGHGIPDTAHSVRHWYGTHIYRITQDLRLVQDMMGHSSPATTAVYTAFDPPNADHMAAALDTKIGSMLGRRHLRVVGDSDS